MQASGAGEFGVRVGLPGRDVRVRGSGGACVRTVMVRQSLTEAVIAVTLREGHVPGVSHYTFILLSFNAVLWYKLNFHGYYL